MVTRRLRPEDDPKKQEQSKEKDHCDHHGTQCRDNALQQHQHLWHSMQQLRDAPDAGEAQELCHPENDQLSASTPITIPMHDVDVEWQGPGLNNHQGHQSCIEAEPPVLQTIAFPLESAKANQQLQCEERTEEVVKDLDVLGHGGHPESTVAVCIDDDPNGVEHDGTHGESKETRALGNGRAHTLLSVELSYRIIPLGQAIVDLLLYLLVVPKVPPHHPALCHVAQETARQTNQSSATTLAPKPPDAPGVVR
mmetsp:Transcript_56644/g.156773  ORF Transcript_56644/g.156773 Transcript_56644/m.156773 type:complete len:252 (-) Transcript_56644:348-1103(-)